MALLFDWMEPSARARLAKFIETLPRVHRLQDDTPTHTAILSELLSGVK